MTSARSTDDGEHFPHRYGPLVLAGMTSERWFVPAGDVADPSSFLRRNSTTSLEFEARGRLYSPARASAAASSVGTNRVLGADAEERGARLRLIPLYQVMAESYTVYFDTQLKIIPYAPSGAVVPSSSPADFEFGGGASAAGGPADAACDGANLRSGNPGDHSLISLSHPLLAPGYTVSSVALHFRYAAGYTPAPGAHANASVVSLVLADENGVVIKKLQVRVEIAVDIVCRRD